MQQFQGQGPIQGQGQQQGQFNQNQKPPVSQPENNNKNQGQKIKQAVPAVSLTDDEKEEYGSDIYDVVLDKYPKYINI